MTLLPRYFTDPEDSADWFAARREAIDHILAAVARSPWSARLVLRGEVLTRAWFGERAPEPGCLEFVVRFELWQRPDEPGVGETVENVLADAVAMSRRAGSTVAIDRTLCGSAEIGETDFDCAPYGTRLTLSWQGRGQTGTVHMDLLYGEPLHDPPVPTPIPRTSLPGTPLVLQAASPLQSLAWKIARLAADSGRVPEQIGDEPDYYEPAEDYGRPCPLGRDLYEAVLIAERSPLPLDRLDKILGSRNFLPAVVDAELNLLVQIANDADWNAFAGDDPVLAGVHEQFVWRLMVALAPAFPSGPSQLLSLLTEHCRPEIPTLRAVLDFGGMAAVAQWFADSGHSIAERIVLVRELFGASCSMASAADLVAEMPTAPMPSGCVDSHRVAHVLQPIVQA